MTEIIIRLVFIELFFFSNKAECNDIYVFNEPTYRHLINQYIPADVPIDNAEIRDVISYIADSSVCICEYSNVASLSFRSSLGRFYFISYNPSISKILKAMRSFKLRIFDFYDDRVTFVITKMSSIEDVIEKVAKMKNGKILFFQRVVVVYLPEGKSVGRIL